MNEVLALFTGVEADFEEAKSTKAALLSDFCEMGTQERSRTFTSLRTLRPERSASTNSATWADGRAKVISIAHLVQLLLKKVEDG